MRHCITLILLGLFQYALRSLVVWWFWNSIMPDICGVKSLTYQQSVLMLILAQSLCDEIKNYSE